MSIAEFKRTILEKLSIVTYMCRSSKIANSSVPNQALQKSPEQDTVRKVDDEISKNCTITYISCDTSELSSQTKSQEYKITHLTAFHPQINSKIRRFNKNKNRKYTIKNVYF